MGRVDRRTFLIRGGGLVAAASLPAGWQLVGDALAGVDPRLRALARTVNGPVITPANRSYGHARLVYNERFDAVHPLGIVQPVSVEDVRRVIAWAKKTGVHLAIRSGGHSYAGYSTTQGLVVDLRRLDAISLNPSGIATIGAGARMIDVEAALANRGRAIPAGSCATVGIGGLALGGGVGFASGKFGTTSDNIVSFGSSRPTGATGSVARPTSRTLLGLPGWRRRQLRHRHPLRLSHSRGRARLVLLCRLALGAGRRSRARVAGVCAARTRRALLDLCSPDGRE